MATYEEAYFDRGFIINWVLMSVIGIVLGTTARQFVFDLIFGLVGGGFWGKAVEGAIIGAAIGVAQLFGLPSQIKRNGWWAVAAVLGWGIGWSVGWSVGWQWVGGISNVFTVIGLVAGGLTALGQWPQLRGQVKQAGWWIPGNALGWGLGLASGMFIRGAFGWPVGGAVSGLLTGAVLYWLLARSRSDQ